MTLEDLADPAGTLIMETSRGRVVIDLATDLAPRHVARLLLLTRIGDYDNVAFHRVIEDFVAQAGDVEFGDLETGYDPERVGAGGSIFADLPAEFSDVPFLRGVVGMARSSAPDSANSQFFIMFEPARFLDGRYTVVGEVIDGMDVVDRIKKGSPDDNGAVEGTPDRIVSMAVASDLMGPLAATQGADRLIGGPVADRIAALGGDDVVKSGAGADLVFLGVGADRVLAGDGDDTVFGGDGDDVILPGRGNDVIEAGHGDDIARGFRGDELLIGGDGNDTLLGGLDDDTLIGGAGDDRLQGGPGRDTFVFDSRDFGHDRIVLDFRPGSDAIDFRGSGYGFDDLTISQSGGNVLIEAGDSSILVSAVRLGPLDVADFTQDMFLFG